MTTRRDFLKAGAAIGAMALTQPRIAGAKDAYRPDSPEPLAPTRQPANTYTLLLKITGLALLVVDKGQTPQLRVLLPKTDNSMKHELRAYSDLWSGGVVINGDITVPAMTGTPSLTWGNGLENLTSVFESKVDPALAAPSLSNKLEARLNIRSGAVHETSTWRGRWLVYTEFARVDLSPYVTWNCTLPIGAQPLPGTAIPTISPAAGSTVEVEVRHAPAAEQGPSPTFPKEPRRLASAPHFQFVKGLFEPRLKGDLHWWRDLGTKLERTGITPFSCMIGGGDIGP